jgi:hypothetical protein
MDICFNPGLQEHHRPTLLPSITFHCNVAGPIMIIPSVLSAALLLPCFPSCQIVSCGPLDQLPVSLRPLAITVVPPFLQLPGVHPCAVRLNIPEMNIEDVSSSENFRVFFFDQLTRDANQANWRKGESPQDHPPPQLLIDNFVTKLAAVEDAIFK